MEGFKITPAKALFAVSMTMLMVLMMVYLKVAFKEADVKTAVRLVEQAKAGGETLGQKMDKVLPSDRRLCEASVLSEFHGHMEVSCKDIQTPAKELRWQVNVLDGMVRPSGLAAEKLGRGEVPW